MPQTLHIFKKVINEIAALPGVSAIGLSGGKENLPKAGEGDIDIFIYCSTIPTMEARSNMFGKLVKYIKDRRVQVFDNPYWGCGDFFRINGVETWLMFFPEEETSEYLQAVLRGEHLEKVANYFYPVGRCAMFNHMWVMHDPKGFIKNMKDLLVVYPESLVQKMLKLHLKELDSTEDLQRAVLREDVLFYHFALDIALDHFLLALFALNRQYFPSRKRSWEHINRFIKKPLYCENRLLKVVKLGSEDVTLEESFQEWCNLVMELQELCNYLPLIEEYVR